MYVTTIWCSWWQKQAQTSMMTIFGLPTSDTQRFSGARSTSTLINSPSTPYSWPLCVPWLRIPTATQSCDVWSSSATDTANQRTTCHVCNATLFSCWQLNVGITHTVTRNIQATAENVPICIMTEHHPALLWCFSESGAAIYNTLWLTYLFTEYWTNRKVYRTKLQHKIIKWWKKGHRVCKNLLHLSPIWNNSCLVVVDRQIH